MLQLPILKATPEQQSPIVALVEQIMAAKKNVGANGIRPPLVGDTNDAENGKYGGDADKGACNAPLQNPRTDIPALEAEIDRLVYVLYGLKDEGIAVVEGKV